MFDLNESPIRKNIAQLDDGQLSIFEDEDFPSNIRIILDDIMNMLDTMKKNSNKKMKMAVVGEVKAGKSTFVNALVGKEVAYMDVLEATAVVSEITYSSEEYVRAYDKNGNVKKEFTFEELIEWTEELLDNDDVDVFYEYDRIEIGVNNENLKDIVLVDTPGLLTITTENHDITSEYIAQADYILWVVDGTCLGAKSVDEMIEKTKSTGKPIIGIINKVDNDKVLSEVKPYVEKRYSNLFDEIYYVSSYQAFKLHRNNDSLWKEKSGFIDIIESIEEFDKEYSSKRTQQEQLQREKAVHEKCEAIIKSRKQYYDRELDCFARVNVEIKKNIQNELKEWARDRFFVDEKNALLSSDKDSFVTLMDRYNDATYITGLINQKYEEVLKYIYSKWEIVINNIKEYSSEFVIDFSYDATIELNNSANIGGQDVNSSTAIGASGGLKKGAMYGMAFAGFSAWLGPAAATLSFAELIVPVVVPIALAGAGIEALIKKNSIDTKSIEENEKKKKACIEGLYETAKEALCGEMERNFKSLLKCSDMYYEQKCDDYMKIANKANFDFNDPKYSEFMNDLRVYIDKINETLNFEIAVPERPEFDE